MQLVTEFTINNRPASRNEVHLLQEALRRACNSVWNKGVAPDLVLAAIIAEAEKGTRDMHGLVSAAGQLQKSA